MADISDPKRRAATASPISEIPPDPRMIDKITVGGSPVTGDLPPVGAVHTWTVKADLTKSYVAGFPSYRLNLPQPLPLYIDPLTAAFGDDLYERMMLDAVVKASVNILKLGILQQGLTFRPGVEKDDPEYDSALKVCAFVKRVFERLDTHDFLWQMLDAIPFGFKVAEKEYEIADDREIGSALVIKDIIVKPRRTVAVVVDSYLKVLGYLGVIPGQAAPILYGTILTDLAHQPNFIAASKFCHLTHDPMDRHPQGQSALRSAYNAWYFKAQIWPELLKFAAQFGTPSTYATSPEGAQPSATFDAAGNQIFLSDGVTPQTITPEQLLVNTLAQLRNGSAAAFPFGTVVEVLQAPGGGEVLTKIINELMDSQIRTAITGQTLATSEGIHQARAASGVHQDILGMYIGYGKTIVEGMIRRDILEQLVTLNFGERAMRLLPKVSLSDTETQDFPQRATAVAALDKAGYLDESQLPGVDASLGLPARAEGWEARRKEAKQPVQANDGDPEKEPASGTHPAR